MDRFESLGLKGGVWQGVVRREQPFGRVVLTHLGEVVALAQVVEDGEKSWRISVTIPSERLVEGVQSFLLFEDHGEGLELPQPGAVRLASMPMIAGVALDEDILAELSLFRSELDMLKREFRRMAAALAESRQ